MFKISCISLHVICANALKIHEPIKVDIDSFTYDEICGDRNNYKCWKSGGASSTSNLVEMSYKSEETRAEEAGKASETTSKQVANETSSGGRRRRRRRRRRRPTDGETGGGETGGGETGGGETAGGETAGGEATSGDDDACSDEADDETNDAETDGEAATDSVVMQTKEGGYFHKWTIFAKGVAICESPEFATENGDKYGPCTKYSGVCTIDTNDDKTCEYNSGECEFKCPENLNEAEAAGYYVKCSSLKEKGGWKGGHVNIGDVPHCGNFESGFDKDEKLCHIS